jgi:hypothetical protein
MPVNFGLQRVRSQKNKLFLSFRLIKEASEQPEKKLNRLYISFKIAWPILSRFVFKYDSLCGFEEISIGTVSTISNP